MPSIPGISSSQAIRVFSKIGFRIAREGKHTIMSNGKVRLTIPRHNPINAFTMGGIVREGLALKLENERVQNRVTSLRSS